MRVHIITLFPECFESYLEAGLVGRAIGAGLLHVELTNPRDFARDKHRTVDDAPYGGGSGMVLMAEPLVAALEDVAAREAEPTRRILLTPQGQVFDQRMAQRLSAEPALVLLCGRYEGVDERVRAHVDEEVSLGDFVLFGGEVAAMAVLEATARLVPGVLGNAASSEEESHVAGLLEYPQYTRPADLAGRRVPPVLMSGDHAAIARWRRQQSLLRTRARRPDLFARLELDEADRALLAQAEEDGS